MFARSWNMIAWIWRPRWAVILAELKLFAAAGDIEGLISAMQRWNNLQSMPWVKLDLLEMILSDHDEINDLETLVLHRVLVVATKAGQLIIVRYLLEHGCVIWLPATRAAFKYEQWAVLELFLDKGWDINSAVMENNTYPILKEMLDSEKKVRWCLDHGADPMRRTAAGDHDVTSISGCYGSLSIIKLFQKYGVDYAQSDALQNAALGGPGRVEVMAYLIKETGFPINQLRLEFVPNIHRGYAGNGLGTALHSAVEEKCAETLKFLLENGADRDKPDTVGKKPLDLARQNRFHEGVALLSNYHLN